MNPCQGLSPFDVPNPKFSFLSLCNLLRRGHSTLLWFRLCVCPSRFDLVNTIETKPLCASSSNLADMFTLMRGWTLLILEVKGEGHDGHHWQIWGARGCYTLRCNIWSLLPGMGSITFKSNLLRLQLHGFYKVIDYIITTADLKCNQLLSITFNHIRLLQIFSLINANIMHHKQEIMKK